MDDLVAREQIREALVRYARGVDRLDAALIDACFWPDAIIEHGGMVFDGEHWGEAIVSTMGAVAKRSRHMLSNHFIELDGDTAFSECYCNAYVLEDGPDGEQLLNRGVRYIDQFERRGGEWRSVFRQTVLDWDRIEPIVDRPPVLEYVQPGRGTDDPSYRRPLKPIDYDRPVTNGDWKLR